MKPLRSKLDLTVSAFTTFHFGMMNSPQPCPNKTAMKGLEMFKGLLRICALAFALVFTIEAVEGPKVGDAPPALQLGALLHGPAKENVTWTALKDKVVVVEFWNTLCGPCIEAIPHWNELVARFANDPVVFLSISDDNPDRLKKFLEKRPISGWLAIDGPLAPTAADFGVVGIPHTVLVDRSGKIAAITHPYYLKAEHIQELLDRKPSSLPPPQPEMAPRAAAKSPDVALPQAVEVSITGPFPKPEGAYAHQSWRFNCIFRAEKAPAPDILATFFQVSKKLLPPLGFGDELYNVTAAAPPEKRAELNAAFINEARAKWHIAIEPIRREFDVYVMTIATTNAPALKRVKSRGGGGQIPGGFKMGGQPISATASYLEMSLDKPVIDETHLDGLWASELKWEMIPEELSSDANPDPAKVVKAAREQLGLELRPARRELPTLNIRELPR